MALPIFLSENRIYPPKRRFYRSVHFYYDRFILASLFSSIYWIFAWLVEVRD